MPAVLSHCLDTGGCSLLLLATGEPHQLWEQLSLTWGLQGNPSWCLLPSALPSSSHAALWDSLVKTGSYVRGFSRGLKPVAYPQGLLVVPTHPGRPLHKPQRPYLKHNPHDWLAFPRLLLFLELMIPCLLFVSPVLPTSLALFCLNFSVFYKKVSLNEPVCSDLKPKLSCKLHCIV